MPDTLRSLGWKETTRAANYGQKKATLGLLIFLAVYFLLLAVSMGFLVSENLPEKYEGINIIRGFNEFLFSYIIFDILVRIMMQSLPTTTLKPLLSLPVRRKEMASFMLRKSLIHFFNLWPIFLVLPFFFIHAVNILSPWQLAGWIVALLSTMLFNHFIAVCLKWETNQSKYLLYIILAIVIGLNLLQYFGIIDFNREIGRLYNYVLENPLAGLAFTVLPVLAFVNAYRYLTSRFYLDELPGAEKEFQASDKLNWIGNLGEYGQMLMLEVKMLMRNKRTRSTVYMSVLFILYGLIIYKQPQPGWFLFGGIFMIGLFQISYGQFFPAWHSRYYPFLMANNIKMRQFLINAVLIMAGANLFMFLLSLGYVFLYPDSWHGHLAAVLYNIGINIPVIFWFGLRSRKAIDLDGNAMFNYQGMGASQWLMTFPLMGLPMVIYGVVSYFTNSWVGMLTVGALGLIGIFTHSLWLTYFVREYKSVKHEMISAYKAS